MPMKVYKQNLKKLMNLEKALLILEERLRGKISEARLKEELDRIKMLGGDQEVFISQPWLDWVEQRIVRTTENVGT